MKKFISLILAVCMLLTLAACNNTPAATEPSTTTPTEMQKQPSTDPLEMITEGYYTYSFFVEGYGQYDYYFRFYEEDPVLGAIFYAGFCNNQMNFAGTYTVEEKECAYKCFADRDAMYAETYTEGTAPYTVTFYDWNGNVLGSCGYDGNILYNDLTELKATGSENYFYHHDISGEESKYAESYAGETGVSFLSFVGTEDDTCTLQLFHNGTYVDLVGMIVEGTWSAQQREDGGYDFALTPYDSDDTGAILSVSNDAMSAAYTPEGSTAMEMQNAAATAAQVQYVLEGTMHLAQYGVDSLLVLSLYDDGIAVLEADVYGSKAVIDQGTYVMVNEYTFGVTMEKLGYLESTIDFATLQISLHCIGSTDLGEMDVILTLKQEETPSEEAEVLFSFTGNFCALDIMNDNSFVFSFEAYNLKETGTWSFDVATFTFMLEQSNGNTITAGLTEDYALQLIYTAVASDQLSDTFTCAREIWGAALMQ